MAAEGGKFLSDNLRRALSSRVVSLLHWSNFSTYNRQTVGFIQNRAWPNRHQYQVSQKTGPVTTEF